MRRAPSRLSAYEKGQTLLALQWQPVNLSERCRAGHRKREQDMIRRALAHLPPEALKDAVGENAVTNELEIIKRALKSADAGVRDKHYE